MGRLKNTEEKFWSKVKNTGTCWVWMGSLDSHGYGQFYWNRKLMLAHRLAYEFAIGPVPKNLLVRHTCDNPRCCNFEHLIVGTHRENSQDMYRRKRDNHVRGESSPRSKISEKDVATIREMRARGYFLREIGAKVGLHLSQVSKILKGKFWRHTVTNS